MNNPKDRSCMKCGNKGFKWFKLTTKGWLCPDCRPDKRSPASPEERQAALDNLRNTIQNIIAKENL